MSQASLFAIGAFVFAITVFATLFYGYVVFSRSYGAGLPKGQVFPGFQGTLREEGSSVVRPQASQTVQPTNENSVGA
jgi:Acetyltransferase (GNAT) family